MRWGTPNDSADGINFDETFAKEGFNAPRFLRLDNVVGEVKRQNDKVTDKLIANPNILIDLVSICLKPKSFSHHDLPLITNQHTYNAIEILSNLTQQFGEFLFSSSNSAHIPDDNDDVVTDDPAYEEAPLNPVLIHLMSLLDEEKPIDETALSYLVKIVTSLCYQKPKQMIMALFNAENICKQIFQHFYSRSVYEWFIRLLEIEDSASFFQKQKLMFFKMCVSAIDSEHNENLLLEKLENYQSIFQVLLQKIDDRFDKAKFSSMVKQLLTQQNCLVFLFHKMVDYPEKTQIFEQILSILEIYLRFSSNHRSINSSKNSDNLENSIYEIRLNNDSIKEIKTIVKSKQIQILDINLKKSLTRKYLELIRALIIFDSDFIPEILTKKFVSDLLKIFINNPSNNILHNLVRDILIESINKSYQHISTILLDKDTEIFIQMARKCMGNNSGKKSLYQNQIYLIFQALSKKGEQNSEVYQQSIKCIQNYEQIVSNMKEKQKFYSKLIGGNARKQSSCWGDSSADIVFDKIFPTNGNSDKKIDLLLNQKDTTDFIEGNQNQHWFDCGGLPLDSDSSREDVSENQIENCLSPRTLKSLQSPSQNEKTAQILANSDELDFPLPRQNSDIKIDLSELKINSNVKIETEKSHQKAAENISKLEGGEEMEQLGGTTSFNTFFSTYQSFQLEAVLSQIQ